MLPGQEIVADFGTAVVSARKRLDEIHQFFRHGNFAAALALLAGAGYAWPTDLQPLVALLVRWAEFYSAWDRLDYQAAQAVSSATSATSSHATWNRFAPTAAMRDWVDRLAKSFPPDCPDRATRLRFQVLDLLASAERRLRDHHFEDVIIRAYRIVEMVGQLRLFQHGLDSGSLPVDHPAVRDLQNKLLKDRDEVMGSVRNHPELLQAGRLQVARLLKRLKDPLHKLLLQLGENPFIAKRNKGILIHGYEPLGSTDADTLRDFLHQLEQLVQEDGQLAGFDVLTHLQVARSCGFSP